MEGPLHERERGTEEDPNAQSILNKVLKCFPFVKSTKSLMPSSRESLNEGFYLIKTKETPSLRIKHLLHTLTWI